MVHKLLPKLKFLSAEDKNDNDAAQVFCHGELKIL